ncbi:MAG: ribulose bisphosphate carboxylase small subunit [Coriobacteriia bacterium]|nr:ribulose bisphosphate carboxylase small subunit [Coriobacteriia bacterium]
MRITQGAFSFLPDLTDHEVRAQVEYCLDHSWAIAVEYTDDPHPRNVYWEMWGAPMFDLRDAAGVMAELDACRTAFPQHYIRINAFDASFGVESVALSFIVARPDVEPGFRLERTAGPGRTQRYSVVSYAVGRASEGERYGTDR